MRIIDTQGLDTRFPAEVADSTGRIFMSRLPNVATALALASGKAYFIYVGRTTHSIVAQHIYFYVNSAGAGTETAEVGVFSSPAAPSNAGQVLTKLAAVGHADIDSLKSTGVKWNSNLRFDKAVPAGTHLWAGIRTEGYSTQPALAGLCMDFNAGLILSANSSSTPFTGATTSWTGALIPAGTYMNTAMAPDLRLALNYGP